MNHQRSVIVLICVVTLVEPASAQIEQDVATIADHYLIAMQRKGYSFLSKDELLRRRDQIAAFTTKHLDQQLDEPTRLSILKGIDRCLDRFYTKPVGEIDYGNGFGSGGEEWMYLNDRDYFLTFQYHLWFGLKRPALSPADMQRRDRQRQWMRQYLTDVPTREALRRGVMVKLENAFADPLNLLSKPMPDDGFEKLRDRFKQFSNGIDSDFHDMEVAALTSRFVSMEDPAGRYGYRYSGRLPFDDTVVSLWGNGPSLSFASNAGFRGHHGGLSKSVAYDVIRCIEMRVEPNPANSETAALEAWLTREGRGELTLDGPILFAVRGTKIAKLTVSNSFDADKLTEDQLHAVIQKDGRDQISIKGLPTMNGPHRGDRSEGEFFIVVENRERRLAVINLHNYERDQLMFWCRPRTIEPNH